MHKVRSYENSLDFLANPEFNAPYYGFLPIEDRYGESVRQEAALAKKLNELNLTNHNDVRIFTNMAITMDGSALALHRLAFVPPILSQGSKEQVEKWKPLMDSYQMLGSYAQTELGHGWLSFQSSFMLMCQIMYLTCSFFICLL